MNNKICCFTGYRKFNYKDTEKILPKLKEEVHKLIENGVTTFISGGAVGFDQICASFILTAKEIEEITFDDMKKEGKEVTKNL